MRTVHLTAPLAGRWPSFGSVIIVLAELRRAIAAEQRYDELRRKNAAALTLEGIARTEIPRRIFEEFYSFKRAYPRQHLQATKEAETMRRLSVLAPLLLCLWNPAPAVSGTLARETEVNGVRLSYEELGSGEPIVFVHGALSGPSSWDPVKGAVAKKYRAITYTQRYYGAEPWNDDGKQFSAATHADDLAKFIAALNTGPVHLVGWSYGGLIATTAAIGNPSLVRTLILYEASVGSVLAADSPEAKAAREDRLKMFGPAMAANKAGNAESAIRLMYEAVYQLPPGEFDRLPHTVQERVLENARTIPLLFAAPPPPVITCDALKGFARPTLVMRGERTQTFYALTSDAIARCVPGARHVVLPNANHDGPARNPVAFTAAVFEFLSKR